MATVQGPDEAKAGATGDNTLGRYKQTSNGSDVVGVIAHDDPDLGASAKIGFKAYSPDGTTPGTAVAEGDRTDGKADLDGRQFVNPVHPRHWSYHADSTSAVKTDDTVQADPGDGFAIFVTGITFSIGADTASSIFFEEGSTKILGPWYFSAQSGNGIVKNFLTPKQVTPSTALTVTNTGATTYSIDVEGFIAAV